MAEGTPSTYQDLFNFLRLTDPPTGKPPVPGDVPGVYPPDTQRPIPEKPYSSVMASVPVELLAGGEDPTKFHGIFQTFTKEFLSAAENPFASYKNEPSAPMDVNAVVAAFADEKKPKEAQDALYKYIERDTTSYNQLMEHLSGRGLVFQGRQLSLIEKMHEYLRENDPNWDKYLQTEDNKRLIALAGMVVAAKNSTIRPDVRPQFETEAYNSMYARLMAEDPKYEGGLAEFRRDMDALQEFRTNIVYGPVTPQGKPWLSDASRARISRMVEPELGKPFTADVGADEVLPLVNDLYDKYQTWHNQGLEAAKYRRIGLDIKPEQLGTLMGMPLLAEVPFETELLAKWSFARAGKFTLADPYVLADATKHDVIKKELNDSVETFMAPLWKLADSSQVDRMYEGQVDERGLTPRSRFAQLDEAIRAEKDPDARYNLLLRAYHKHGELADTLNDKQIAHLDNVLTTTRMGEVVRMSGLALAVEKQNPVFDGPQYRAYRDELQAARVRAEDREDAVQKSIEGNLITGPLNWMGNSIGWLFNQSGMGKASRVMFKPFVESIYQNELTGFFDKPELTQLKAPKTFGEYFNQKWGLAGWFDHFKERYADKAEAGEVGFFDQAFMGGAMIVSGLAESPGLLYDAPLESMLTMKLMGKALRARGPLGEALLKSGMPPYAVATVQLAIDPFSPGESIAMLLGRDAAAMRALGGSRYSVLKKLRETTPTQAARWERWVDDLFAVAKQSGMPLDQAAVDGFRTAFASLLTKAQSKEKLSWRDTQDLINFGTQLGPGLSQIAATPWKFHGQNFNEYLPMGSHVAEAAKIKELEGKLQNEFEPEIWASKIEQHATPAMVFRRIYDSFFEGTVKSVEEATRRVLSPFFDANDKASLERREMWVTRVADIVDKRIKADHTLIYDQILFGEAVSRLTGKADEAGAHRRLYNVLVHSAEEDQKFVQAEGTAAGGVLEALKKARMLVMQVDPTWLQKFNTAIERQVEVVKKWEEQFKRNDRILAHLRTNQGRLDQLIVTRASHIGGRQDLRVKGAIGLEAGWNPEFLAEDRRLFLDWLYESNRVGLVPTSMSRLPRGLMGLVAEANKEASRALNKLGPQRNALQLALKAFADSDYARAAALLGTSNLARVLGAPNEITVRAALVEANKTLASSVKEINRTAKEKLFNKVEQAGAWKINPLDTNLTEVIQHTRNRIGELLAPHDPTTDFWQALIGPRREGVWRVFGLMSQQKRTLTAATDELIDSLDEDVNRLPKPMQEQYANALTMHPDQWGPELPQEVRDLALREQAFRHQLVDRAEKLGVIPAEEAFRIKSQGYQDRYYTTKALRSRIEETGRIVRPESIREERTMMQSAPLMAFEAAAHPDYARVFYRDWRHNGGDWNAKRFEVSKYGGRREATEAANKWIEEMQARGELRKGEFKEVVRPLDPVSAAERGMVEATGALRHQKLKDMHVELTRREMFAQLANYGGLTRASLDGIPNNRHGEWLHVTGEEWGMLRGQYIHKTIARQINSWTGYGKVLDAIAREAQKDFAMLDGFQRGWFPTMVEASGKLFGVRHLDAILRHNLIIANLSSWTNNVMTNLTSMMLAGVNPLDWKTWKYALEYQKLTKNLPETFRLARAHEAQNYDSIERQYAAGAKWGMLQTTADAATDVSEMGQLGGWKAMRAEESASFSREVNQMRLFQESAANIEIMLHQNPDLTDLQRFRLEKRLKIEREMADEQFNKILSSMGLFKTRRQRIKAYYDMLDDLETGAGGRGEGKASVAGSTLREVKRAVFAPNKSYIRKNLATEYSRVDSRFKWIMYRALTDQKKLPQDAALSRVDQYMQNYTAVPPMVRNLKDVPVLGAFVPGFAFEAGRVLYNTSHENIGRPLTLLTRMFALNSGTLASMGMMPSDLSQFNNDESAFDFMRKMFFSLIIPSKTGLHTIDMSNWSVFSPFLQGSGIGKAFTAKFEKDMSRELGPWAIPAAMVLNWASNFVGNTPYTGPVARVTMGVDPYRQEMVYERSTAGEMLAGVFTDYMRFFAPNIMIKTTDSAIEAATSPVSLITKHKSPWVDTVLRWGTGFNIRTRDRNEAIAGLLISLGGTDTVKGLWKTGMDSETRAYRVKVFESQTAATEEERRAALRDAFEMARALKSDNPMWAGRPLKQGMTDDQIAEKVVRDASRNIFDTIEQLPARLVLEASRRLVSAGIAKPEDEEIQHMFYTLTDDRSVGGMDNPVEIAAAAQLADEYARTTSNAYLQGQYSLAAAKLTTRLIDLLQQIGTTDMDKLLKMEPGKLQKFENKMRIQEILEERRARR